MTSTCRAWLSRSRTAVSTMSAVSRDAGAGAAGGPHRAGHDQHRRQRGHQDRRPGRGREPRRRSRGRPDARPRRPRRRAPRRARHRPRRAAEDHGRGGRLEGVREPGDQRPLARVRARGHRAGPPPRPGPGRGSWPGWRSTRSTSWSPTWPPTSSRRPGSGKEDTADAPAQPAAGLHPGRGPGRGQRHRHRRGHRASRARAARCVVHWTTWYHWAQQNPLGSASWSRSGRPS